VKSCLLFIPPHSTAVLLSVKDEQVHGVICFVAWQMMACDY